MIAPSAETTDDCLQIHSPFVSVQEQVDASEKLLRNIMDDCGHFGSEKALWTWRRRRSRGGSLPPGGWRGHEERPCTPYWGWTLDNCLPPWSFNSHLLSFFSSWFCLCSLCFHVPFISFSPLLSAHILLNSLQSNIFWEYQKRENDNVQMGKSQESNYKTLKETTTFPHQNPIPMHPLVVFSKIISRLRVALNVLLWSALTWLGSRI